jgi:HD-like signal output (HDOD) protein
VNPRLELTGLQQTLRKRLMADVAELPVLPHVVVDLLRLSPGDDNYFDSVARIVAKDPGTTTRLLNLANSAATRGSSEVRTINEAMVRVGARGISALVATLGVAKAVHPKTPPERALWVHALDVAHIARSLGALLSPKEVNAEELYLAGLMHDIGRFVMLVEAGDEVSPILEGKWSEPQEALDSEVSACGIDHNELGGLVCTYWKMPDVATRAALYHHRPKALTLPAAERRSFELVVAADLIASGAALLQGGRLGPATDEASIRIITKGLPLWAGVEASAIARPVGEAVEAARRAAQSMGIKV